MTTTTDIATALDTFDSTYDFSVVKHALAHPFKSGENTSYYGLFRNDTWDQVHGVSVGPDYAPHTVGQVRRTLKAGLQGVFKDVPCTAVCTFNKGHRIIAAPTREFRKEVFGTDTIWPRLLIDASYNGCVEVSLVGYRDRCLNLAELSSQGCKHRSKWSHRSSLNENFDHLVEKFEELDGAWELMGRRVERMRDTTVDFAEFLREVVQPNRDKDLTSPQTKLAEGSIIRLMNEVAKYHQLDLGEDRFDAAQVAQQTIKEHKPVSLWHAFNAIQGERQHGSTRHGKVNNLQRAYLALDDKYVDRLNSVIDDLLSTSA